MPRPDTFASWLRYIESLHPKKMDLGLKRLQPLVRHLPKPPGTCIITIAGTNGKGTTAHALARIYQANGQSTAVYTSPHVHTFRERLLYQGSMLSEANWVMAFEWVASKSSAPLTFFEYTTMAAVKLAFDRFPDILILEVGLGGRLDAVNVYDPDVAIITSIAMDHQALLGNSLDAIAIEKSGVFRSNVPAIYASLGLPKTLQDHIAVCQIPCRVRGRDFEVKPCASGSSWVFTTPQGTAVKCHKSTMMHESCLAAIYQTVEVLRDVHFVPWHVVQKIVSDFQLMGRFERHVLQHGEIVYDVAHNPAACLQLYQNLISTYPQKRMIVFAGFGADKDVRACLDPFIHRVDAWYFFSLHGRASHTPKMMKNYVLSIVPQARVVVEDDVLFDPELVLAHDRLDTVIVVMGSFLMVDRIRQLMPEPKQDQGL